MNPDGSSAIAYAMRFTQGGEEERVRGKIKLYPADSPSLSLTKPSVSITSPVANSETAGGTVQLKASLTKSMEESYRISWFVADGEIPKRRAAETDWENMGGGNKTIIVTIRGLQSWNFAIDKLDTIIK